MLASPAALAQSVSLGFAGGTVTTNSVNQSDCNSGKAYTVTWNAQGLGSGNVCNNMQIFVTNGGSCPDSPTTSSTDGGTSDSVIGTVSITELASGSGSLPANAFRDMPGLGGSCPDGIDISNTVCASVSYRAVGATSCTNLGASQTLTLRYDAKPPDPPSMNLLPQDSKIVVQLGNNGDSSVSYYRVEYAPAPAGDAGPNWVTVTPDLSATNTSQSITRLTNGVDYLVRARSLDEVLNISSYNTALSATPQASNGFWGEYKDAGGHELGGCTTADATVPSLVGVLVVLGTLAWRRR